MNIRYAAVLAICGLVLWMAVDAVKTMNADFRNPPAELTELESFHDEWDAPVPRSAICWMGVVVPGGGSCSEKTLTPTRVFEGYQVYSRNGNGKYFWPVDSFMVSSLFGYRSHPVYHDWRFHEGIDVPCKIGDPVYASAHGKVVFSGISGSLTSGAGRMVLLDNGSGWGTQYMHLSSLLVEKDQLVEAGDVIALCGNTGTSTGPHLHFEVMDNWSGTSGRDGKGKKDPLDYLPPVWHLKKGLVRK